MEKGVLCGPRAEPQHGAQELPGYLTGGALATGQKQGLSWAPGFPFSFRCPFPLGQLSAAPRQSGWGCDPPAVSTSHKSRQDWSLNMGHFHAVPWSILWGQLP